MKFIVTRTTDDDRNWQPCPEAVREAIVNTQALPVDDPAKYRTIWPIGSTDWWYGHGTNHRVEDGRAKRDFIEQMWTVDILSLTDLLMFLGRHGRLVLNESHYDGPDDMPHIEIYDGWRE